jgi:hypothetical protein
MTEVKSLRAEILERLRLHKGGAKTASHNIETATKDFYKSDAPQFRGKSKEKRHQMAVAAGLRAARGESKAPTGTALTESVTVLKKGSNVLYKGKPAKVETLNESTGMATVKLPRKKEPIFVRSSDLQPTTLSEAVLGMSPIGFTYVEPRRPEMMRLENLSASDIGLMYEDDDEEDHEEEVEDKDGQEEDYDNGSNVRHDGHTGKTEIDNLPTPSDTIAPAYSDEKPPKEEGSPLSIEKGAEEAHLWDKPNWDGYDYPADAPDIPTADFPGSEMGNARAPDQSDHHDGGDGQEDRDEDESKTQDDKKNESRAPFSFTNYKKLLAELDEAWPDSASADTGNPMGRSTPTMSGGMSGHGGVAEEDDDPEASGGDTESSHDTEPSDDATITLTMAAMASVMCTAAHKLSDDPTMMKAVIEAMAEVGKGKTLDIGDLDAVASHVNGEEGQEMQNREDGESDHNGMDHGHLQGDSGEGGAHDDGGSDDWETPSGDGEPGPHGKTKLMGGMGESMWYNEDDIIAETAMSEEDEIRLVKQRAGLKYW